MLLCLLHLDVSGIERHYIRFQEKAIPGFSTSVTAPLPAKSERTSSRKGCIVMIFDESVPDSIRVALTAAKEAWEAKLPAAQEIYIQAAMRSMEPNISMQTYVAYDYTAYPGAPNALASQLFGTPVGTIEGPDSYIYLNRVLNWNCNFSSDKSAGYNAYTAGLRAIAISMGFGSSVCNETGKPLDFYFASVDPTYFDNQIYKDKVCLNTLQSGSPDFNAFVTSNSLYVKGKKYEHRLYAPSPFIWGISLVYLDDESSLMHYAVGEGDKMLTIDTNTLDILNGIGWDFALQQEGAKIKCNDIASDGIGSSYSDHTFSLDTAQTVNSYEWTYFLKNKSGNFVEVSKGTNSSFTINPIKDQNNYYINMNGDIEGKIECRYKIGDKIYKASPFNISLELKPIIISIDNITRFPTDGRFYYVSFTVNYRGADNLSIEIEEEYSPVKIIKEYEEPFLAHVSTDEIHSLYYNWVTVSVQNKYGYVQQTLEFAPELPTGLNDVQESQDGCNVEILNLQGICVSHDIDGSINKLLLPQGVYISCTIGKNGQIKTRKFIIK